MEAQVCSLLLDFTSKRGLYQFLHLKRSCPHGGPSPSSDRLFPPGMLHFRHHGLLKPLRTLFLKYVYYIAWGAVGVTKQTGWLYKKETYSLKLIL